jgi:hypothetical protein
MKKILIILMSIIIIASFVACGSKSSDSQESTDELTGVYAPNQTATAYSYIHGGYIGRAIAKTDANGDITVSLDEAFLPHVLATIDIEAAEWTEDNTVLFDSHGDTYAAKYIEYSSKKYIGISVGKSLSYVAADESGAAVGNTDLEMSIIRDQASMAAFYALVPAGQFKIFTEFGGDAIPVATTSNGGPTKKASPGYWAFGQTWIGNITAIEEFIAENGVQLNLAKASKAKEENASGIKLWSIADAVSGATNSDFKEYFGLAQYAAGKLTSK